MALFPRNRPRSSSRYKTEGIVERARIASGESFFPMIFLVTHTPKEQRSRQQCTMLCLESFHQGYKDGSIDCSGENVMMDERVGIHSIHYTAISFELVPISQRFYQALAAVGTRDWIAFSEDKRTGP